MLETNWKIWAAANNVCTSIPVVPWTFVLTRVSFEQVIKDCNIAETIDAVLTDTDNTEKRAAQLGVDELLK